MQSFRYNGPDDVYIQLKAQLSKVKQLYNFLVNFLEDSTF